MLTTTGIHLLCHHIFKRRDTTLVLPLAASTEFSTSAGIRCRSGEINVRRLGRVAVQFKQRTNALSSTNDPNRAHLPSLSMQASILVVNPPREHPKACFPYFSAVGQDGARAPRYYRDTLV
ncbi:hypothetical protein [Undibacterium sp. SXout20W]|uniref:hypothetical protein n=1 Tax=Undibacterium sp. SXout20W TaxID=3413051 RepID=UPI003BF02D62